MHILDGQPPFNTDIVNRAAKVQPRGDAAVNVAWLAANQRGDFAQAGAVQAQIHIDALGRYVPAAAQSERAQALVRTIGARGLSRAVDAPAASAGSGWRNIQIRFGEIEDRLGVPRNLK